MREIEADYTLELQIIVTGMHLSPEFGLTYKEIEKSLRLIKKVEMLLSSDTSRWYLKIYGTCSDVLQMLTRSLSLL